MGWSDSAAYWSCIVCPFFARKLMVIWLTRKFTDSIFPKPQLLCRTKVPGASRSRAAPADAESLPASTAFWISGFIADVQPRKRSEPVQELFRITQNGRPQGGRDT